MSSIRSYCRRERFERFEPEAYIALLLFTGFNKETLTNGVYDCEVNGWSYKVREDGQGHIYEIRKGEFFVIARVKDGEPTFEAALGDHPNKVCIDLLNSIKQTWFFSKEDVARDFTLSILQELYLAESMTVNCLDIDACRSEPCPARKIRDHFRGFLVDVIAQV